MSKRALIFPGQGSQKVGMMDEVASHHAQIKTYFSTASDILDIDLWQLVCDGPAEKLNQTMYTQPALLTASVALWHCIADKVTPDYVAGHSLGEYSALVVTGSLTFEDAVALVHLRGKLMQQAVPDGEGLMAAIIGLDDEQVDQACQQTEGVVAAANYNSPGQVVISGATAAVQEAGEKCKALGAKRVMPLPVSIPSHCPLMQSAADEFTQALTPLTIKMPTIPLVHNVTADVASSPDHIKQLLIEQLYSSVRWTQDVKYLIAQGVTEFIECGPGKVLTSLGKRISKDVEFKSILGEL